MEIGKPTTVDVKESANDYQIGGTHYRDMGIQPWDVVDTWPLEQRIGVYRFCSLKYNMRLGLKDDELLEAKKQLQCAQKLVETLEREESKK